MTTSLVRRKQSGCLRTFGWAFALAVYLPLTAPAPVFLKLGEIEGESTDPAHSEWILVESFGFDASRPTPTNVISGLSVAKPLDKASPKLFEACCKGEVLPTGQLDFVTTNASQTFFYQFHFDDTQVLSYTNTPGTNGQPGLEAILLNYNRFSWTYTVVDSGGTNVVDESAWWDIASDTGGDLADRIFRVTGTLQPDGALKVSWEAQAGTTYSVLTSPMVDGAYGELMQHTSGAAGPQQVILPAPMANLFVRLEELP